MKKLNLAEYQEQYKANKLQMIKSKKGKIVSLNLLEDLKNPNAVFDINVNVLFTPEICLQKHLFNQGFLLPYKFSKELEKAKFVLFLLRKNKHISGKEFLVSLEELNQVIHEQIDQILKKHTGEDWYVSKIEISEPQRV